MLNILISIAIIALMAFILSEWLTIPEDIKVLKKLSKICLQVSFWSVITDIILITIFLIYGLFI